MAQIKQVFISHDTESDSAFANRIAADLKKVKIDVWISPESIRPGEGWVEAINRGLEKSSHFLVILTPAAIKSDWVKKEVEVAIALERKGKIEVIPIDLKPCEKPALWESYQMISFYNYESGISQLHAVLGQLGTSHKSKLLLALIAAIEGSIKGAQNAWGRLGDANTKISCLANSHPEILQQWREYHGEWEVFNQVINAAKSLVKMANLSQIDISIAYQQLLKLQEVKISIYTKELSFYEIIRENNKHIFERIDQENDVNIKQKLEEKLVDPTDYGLIGKSPTIVMQEMQKQIVLISAVYKLKAFLALSDSYL